MSRFLRYGPSVAIAMVLVMTMAYAAMIVAVDYAARRDVMRRDLTDGLDGFASATRTFFSTYDAVVGAVAESDCVRSRGRQDCADLFLRLNRRFPDVINFAAIDRQGRFFASGQPFPASGPPDASQRPFFSELAAGQEIYIMDPHKGPVTGETVVGFTVPLRDESGGFDGVIGISTRFTELQTLWNNVRRPADGISILLLDRENRVIFASPKLAFFSSLPEAERGRALDQLRQPEGTLSVGGTWLFVAQSLFDGAWRVATLHPGPYGMEEYLKDGGLLPYLLPPILLLGAVGFAMVHRDWRSKKVLESKVDQRTAELAAANQDLRHSVQTLAKRNQELELFSSVSSHDLREPLRAVSTYVSLLERRYGDALDEDGRAFIGFARDGALRANRVILDLLDYTSAGQGTGEPAMVKPDEVAARVLAVLVGKVAMTGAQVSIEPDMPPQFLCEADLAQLFHHLLDNALTHRHPDRTPVVAVSALQQEGQWVFCVEDNGAGIEPKYFDKVFTLFQRLDPRNAPESTGIGLSICGKLVDKYGGRIWVESIPGSGSRFLFTLPEARPYKVVPDTLPDA